ncbi:ESX-1 secretion-associated protein [Mycobacterium yunnanensis]|uniref:ESX-1 secretion-associated protein n=1 Tax=Mycobacterium yunnanensis TaxID=368477 RepID=A0A9X2YLR3_9MYCO|nr:type VII secretion target [Mycobacterium yunnanensis]MCV7421692.1 ESX-1 secretion-associated protein [Mycobacterium yunnanensis]
MGDIESARVDVGALLAAASRCDAIADAVDGLTRGALSRLAFDGAVAGRDHVAGGDRVRRGVDEIVDHTAAWARAMREIAASLRVSGARYVDVDARGVARLG